MSRKLNLMYPLLYLAPILLHLNSCSPLPFLFDTEVYIETATVHGEHYDNNSLGSSITLLWE